MKTTYASAVALAALASLAIPASVDAESYQFTAISVPNALGTTATAINNSGQIVGYFYTTPYLGGGYEANYNWQGFLYTNGSYRTLNYPGATWTKPLAINDSGQIYGAFFEGYSGPEQTFSYDIASGQFTILPFNLDPSVAEQGALISGISPSGEYIVGSDSNGGFLYSHGNTTYPKPPLPSSTTASVSVAGVNSAGDVVGGYLVSTPYQGSIIDVISTGQGSFVYIDGRYSVLDPRFSAGAIGPSGQILGSYSSPDFSTHPAIYENGTLTYVDPPGTQTGSIYGPNAGLYGINNAGQIVGSWGVNGFVANPNATTPGEQATVYIDSRPSAAIGNSYKIWGWAIDNNAAIVSVSVTIDGQFLGNATYGDSRSDVCAANMNPPGCPNVGWSFQLDTTAVADGSHQVEVIATSAGGKHTTSATTVTVANASITPVSSAHIYVDTPSDNAQVSGMLQVSGWAFNSNLSFLPVSLTLDNQSFYGGYVNYGTPRPDVCAGYGNGPTVSCPAGITLSTQLPCQMVPTPLRSVPVSTIPFREQCTSL